MVSLVDLLDAEDVTETVTIRGKAITCRGLTAHDIATLMLEFEEIRAMMSERQLDPEALMRMAPSAIVKIVAMGGSAVDADLTKPLEMARRLRVDEQVAILAAVLKLTAPEGIVPLVFRVVAGLGFNPVDLVDSVSARVGLGRDQAGRSPSRSNGSSPPATESTTSGDTPPGSSASTASSPIDETSKADLAA